jgi:hypothetical protein
MIPDLDRTQSAPSAMLNPHWWAWNEQVWGVQAEEFSLQEEGPAGGLLAGALFRDRRGRIVTPPLNPHLSIAYSLPDRRTRRLDSQSRAWVSMGDQFAKTLKEAGLANSLILPPGLLDARPFTWNGLRATLAFTYLADLPRDGATAHPSVGKNVRKASARGYSAERSGDWLAILSCLRATEASKGFSHRLSVADLRLGARLMGPDHFRGYSVRDSSGRIVSGGIRLHYPGHRALDWVQGTVRSALADGVNQLMYDFVMNDLHTAGAVGFDLAGANIREVALAKSSWGCPLVPQLSVESTGVLRDVKRWLAEKDAARRVVRRCREMAEALPGRPTKERYSN